jgi:hypothetical protein
MQTALDRRTALAAIASLAATPAAASFVVADADPIFAAIARCEADHVELQAAIAESNRLNRLAESIVGERCCANLAQFDAISGDTDALVDIPAHKELESAKAFCATVPTTIAGLAAMIEYARVLASPEYEMPPECAVGLDPMPAIAKAARELSARGPQSLRH